MVNNPGMEDSENLFGDSEFVSFTHDLQRLTEDRGPGTDMPVEHRTSEDGYKSVACSDFGEAVDQNSVGSPSTVGIDHQHGSDALTRDFRSDALQVQRTQSEPHVNFGVALNVAFNSMTAEPPLQVWETGIWKHIFGDDAELDFGAWGQPVPRPLPSSWGVDQQVLEMATAEPRKRDHGQTCNYMDVVSFKPDIPWPEQRESDLQRGINLWIAVTSRWNINCSFMERLSEMEGKHEVFDMFAHIFSGRAPVTIRKRGHAILRVCDHLETSNVEQFPMKEITLYKFFCSERAAGAPASRLLGVMQAMAFCRHVLDMPELQPVLDSKRCSGVAKETNPKEKKQASPLTVQELLKLHSIVDEGEDLWDSIFAGAALLCCYCRGRWGDLMRSEKAFVDKDENGTPTFVETQTGRHKTMCAQMHRHQFLPMVAPVKGVHGADWSTPWVKWRQQKGLEFPPNGLVMPAPDRHGCATGRPLESGECGKWLRRLLHGDSTTEMGPDRRISSHSLKCTFLSFAAKRGLAVPERLMLGYHSSQMHMALVYSRDGAASSLLLLEKLIDEIHRGVFRPDSTRSGRVVESSEAAPSSQSDAVKVELIVSSDEEAGETHVINSDSSGSTSESESSDSDIPADHCLNRTFAPPAAPAGHQRWQHSKLKTIHLTEPGYVRVFVCGRSVGNFHHPVEENPRFDAPVCWQCFKKAAKNSETT